MEGGGIKNVEGKKGKQENSALKVRIKIIP